MTDIFFTQDGEMHPLGEIGELYYSPDEDAAITESMKKIITAEPAEYSFEVNIPREVLNLILTEVCSITRMVLDIVRENGHGRIIHLAKHGRKARTRKKNKSRAFRLLARNRYL